MGDLHSAPAEASAPDQDREGPDAFTPQPKWLLYIIVLVILSVLKALLALRGRQECKPAARTGERRPRREKSADAPVRARREADADANTPDIEKMRAALLAKLREANAPQAVWAELATLGIVPGADAAATRPSLPHSFTRPRRAASDHRTYRAPWRRIAPAGTGPPAFFAVCCV